MSRFERIRLHSERPQVRQIRRAADMLRQGLFAVVPTDTSYVLMCFPGATTAIADILRLRQLDTSHLWAVVCAGLSQAATCVRMDNQAHRILKRCLPGPYTFILPARSSLPKRIFGKRRDVGVRMPDHPVCRLLLEECGEILLCTTLQFPGDDNPAFDPDDFVVRLKHLSCVVLDTGWGGMVSTSVIDLCEHEPVQLREGAGDWPISDDLIS